MSFGTFRVIQGTSFPGVGAPAPNCGASGPTSSGCSFYGDLDATPADCQATIAGPCPDGAICCNQGTAADPTYACLTAQGQMQSSGAFSGTCGVPLLGSVPGAFTGPVSTSLGQGSFTGQSGGLGGCPPGWAPQPGCSTCFNSAFAPGTCDPGLVCCSSGVGQPCSCFAPQGSVGASGASGASECTDCFGSGADFTGGISTPYQVRSGTAQSSSSPVVGIGGPNSVLFQTGDGRVYCVSMNQTTCCPCVVQLPNGTLGSCPTLPTSPPGLGSTPSSRALAAGRITNFIVPGGGAVGSESGIIGTTNACKITQVTLRGVCGTAPSLSQTVTTSKGVRVPYSTFTLGGETPPAKCGPIMKHF